MPIDPVLQGFLNQINAAPKPSMDSLTPEIFRNQTLTPAGKLIEMEQIRDEILPLQGRNIHARIYISTSIGSMPCPVLIFYHGGGWVTGNIESHDSVCRILSKQGHCMVISIDYRLAPENKFPAAVEDAYDALVWIVEHAEDWGIDKSRIAVGGDSAGGNLAAVACIIAKEHHSPHICFQFLLYPSTGYIEEPPSMRENADGYFLTAEIMQWFRKQYLNHTDELKHPYFSPILYSDFKNLPPAFIATAQYDPLRDVGKAYADKLQENGVKVTYKNFETLIHGFANFHAIVPDAEKALEECAKQLRLAFEQT